MKLPVRFWNICYISLLLWFFAGTLNMWAGDFYWETPERLTRSDSRFPSAVSGGTTSVVFWQEIDTKTRNIWLSCQFYTGNSTWATKDRFAGPFSYSGDIPDIYSAAVLDNGTVAVAVLSDFQTISVYVTRDNGNSFETVDFPRQNRPLVAPRIYASSGGKFILFTSLGQDEAFSMLFSRSQDGLHWPDFEKFGPTAGFTNPFIPVVASVPDGDIVVFQAQYNINNRLSYQLFSTKTSDGGASWTKPVMITDVSSLSSVSAQPFSSYNNQRPSLYWFNGKLYIAWERTHYASENAHIWVASLDQTGQFPGEVQEISTEGNANRPVLFTYDNMLSLVWFDTRTGYENVYLALKKGYLWNDQPLSSGQNSSVFAFPVITDAGKELSFIWQQTVSGGKKTVPYIYRLAPDRTVKPPSINCLTFTDGMRGTARKESVRVILPYDSSGIAGFSWIWTQNKTEMPPERFMNLPSQSVCTVTAEKDDMWYFRARTVDYAGNWSEPAEVTYFCDTTPPGKPVINPCDTDLLGFAASNNLHMSWQPDSSDNDIAGYTWSLEFVDTVEKSITGYPRHPRRADDTEAGKVLSELLKRYKEAAVPRPPLRILGSTNFADYANRRNGVYVFSVAAVDTVGNTGLPSSVTLVLNKYVPYTYLGTVEKKTDLFGAMTISLYGGGFSYDGTVSKIYIDSDGIPPYDVTLSAADGGFRVVSDSSITGIHLDSSLKEGIYRIGLLHTDRGLYFSDAVLSVSQNGTVKIENEYNYVPDWKPVGFIPHWHVEVGSILLWLVMIMAFTCMIFVIRALTLTARDAVTVRYEIKALLAGESMPLEKKQKRMVLIKRKGFSLKVKLMSFTILLVLIIVLLVAVPLQYIMVKAQEQTLTEGLQNRVNVLMDGIASGVRAYMPSRNILELSYLPGQSSALKEAEYATITGLNASDSNTNLDYVWASNDPKLRNGIDTDTLVYGNSRVTDGVITKIAQNCTALNKDASDLAGDIASDISELNAEGIKLALKTDTASVKRREEIATVTMQLNERLLSALNGISEKGAGSYPSYDSHKLDRRHTGYMFYKPVLYRQGTDRNYVRGIVFIKISTADLITTVDRARRTILFITMIVGLVAALIGAIGALIVSTIIVRPIRRLAAHVLMIGETKNKEKLAGRDIEIKSHDEIGQLGETVNEMTHGLIRAAQEEHLLMDGKVVQQTFLPLISGQTGAKETTAVLKEKNIECFGYYEGASSVSGDYFDYKKLDDRWYVIIKCDVSGHGVPAALIMTVVATLFRKYFENWSFQTKGTKINELVLQINDFIESLGLKGKFATIILCLFDTQSGTVFMCNAGDNIVHFYDSAAHNETTITLCETPAAGPLPSFMVDMKGGFRVEKTVLKHNDVMLLYTDGIEESTRKFRNSSFEVTKCAEPGLTEGQIHGNHKSGQDSEQMDPERISAIIEAVFAHHKYRLEKYHNPVAGEILEFDFTTCTGTIEEAILALISVEKVFRMYKDPFVTVSDTVKVDRKIDAFLMQHFNLYDTYCSNKNDSQNDPSYLYYTYLKEDDQLDDLTLVAVKRL